jgi:LacI family transcriptional regulator
MPATIRDVARACGVHVSTVSRTFSAPNLVNPETRGRVLATAEHLGYRPNRAARALITGRTTNLGLIVADIANPYFPPMIKAAQSQARLRDHHVFVADTDEDPAVEEELVRALATQVDGIVLCSPRMANGAIEVLAREVPLVVVNRVVADLPTVVMDVANGARQAIDHLVGLGHRELLYLGGPRSSWTNKEIRRSAVGTARSLGVSLTVLDSSAPTEAGGAAAAEAVAREVARAGVTGVLAYNDLLAIGLLGALKGLGLTVPGDISVVGIDDIPLSSAVQLTTVATPTAAAGRTAVDMLLSYDSPTRTGRGPGRPVVEQHIRTSAQTTLPTTLITRQSTGPGPYEPASHSATPAERNQD